MSTSLMSEKLWPEVYKVLMLHPAYKGKKTGAKRAFKETLSLAKVNAEAFYASYPQVERDYEVSAEVLRAGIDASPNRIDWTVLDMYGPLISYNLYDSKGGRLLATLTDQRTVRRFERAFCDWYTQQPYSTDY